MKNQQQMKQMKEEKKIHRKFCDIYTYIHIHILCAREMKMRAEEYCLLQSAIFNLNRV